MVAEANLSTKLAPMITMEADLKVRVSSDQPLAVNRKNCIFSDMENLVNTKSEVLYAGHAQSKLRLWLSLSQA